RTRAAASSKFALTPLGRSEQWASSTPGSARVAEPMIGNGVRGTHVFERRSQRCGLKRLYFPNGKEAAMRARANSAGQNATDTGVSNQGGESHSRRVVSVKQNLPLVKFFQC